LNSFKQVGDELITYSADSRAQVDNRSTRLIFSDGSIEALKWIGVILMTADHINKYLLHDSIPAIFNAGRMAMPIFSFVLAYNLARPRVLQTNVFFHVATKLAIYGALASVPFIGLGGLGWGWWPLNIMATLLVAVTVIFLIDRGGSLNFVLSIIVFVAGGALVEFWWPAIAGCVAAWKYCRKPNLLALFVWFIATAALFFVNKNYWALGSAIVILLMHRVELNVPRSPRFFYFYYPTHLALLYVATRLV
jgi:hypothetical protein